MMTDNRGTEVKTGMRCAFNKSGQVHVGTITEVRREDVIPELVGGRWTNYVPADIRVRADGAEADSVVRDQRNLIVLREGE